MKRPRIAFWIKNHPSWVPDWIVRWALRRVGRWRDSLQRVPFDHVSVADRIEYQKWKASK